MPEENRPSPSRRSVVRAGAWATPAVAIAMAAPAEAASTPITDSYLVMWGLAFDNGEFELSFKNSSAISTLTVTSLTIDVTYDWVNVAYNPGSVSEAGGSNGEGSYILSQYDSPNGVHFYNSSTYLLAPGEVLGDANGDGLYDETDWSTGDSTVLSWVPTGPVGGWVPNTTYTATFTMNYSAAVTPNTPVSSVTLSETATASWTV